MSQVSFSDFFKNGGKGGGEGSRTDTQELRSMFESAYDNPDSDAPKHAGIGKIPLSDIGIRQQVRRTFSDEEISDLASSIALHGLLTPITVIRSDGPGAPYRLICGEKRCRACRKLGMREISANILELRPVPGYTAEEQITVLQIVENLQRSEPELADFISAADGLVAIHDSFPAKELARILGKSEVYARTILAFHSLSADEKKILSCAGFARLRMYTRIRNADPKEADAILSAARTAQDPEEICRIIDEAARKHERKARRRSRPQTTVDGSISRAASWTVSFRRLNKESAGLGDRLRVYLDGSSGGFEEVIAAAITEYLDRHEADD